MINIFVYSRGKFWSELSENRVDDHNVEDVKNTFFISINGTSGNDSVPYFKTTHTNVLTMFFDDTDKDMSLPDISAKHKTYDVYAMTEKQAAEVIEFVKKITQGSTVYIHCTMGVNRSGAVAGFISDYFEQKYSDLLKQNPQIGYNAHISSLLKRVYNEWRL